MSVCLGYQAVYLDKQNSTSTTKIQVLALVLLLLSFSYKVWVKLETVELGYQIAEVRKEALELNLERQELELQYSVMTRPDLLHALSRTRLDLHPPVNGKVFRVVEVS